MWVFLKNKISIKLVERCWTQVTEAGFVSKCFCQEYQRCFRKTKEKLEQRPSERQFDFSEMYIFGKFDAFQRRLNKILEMLDTMSTYSALQDSKIEGLETVTTRFQVSTAGSNCLDIFITQIIST